MRVLLAEPYFTGSHRAWAEGYRDHSEHDVELVTLDGQFWRWRMIGAHLPLAEEVRASVAARGAPDVLLATSMVNLPAFLAVLRTELGGVPVVLYMHENQLTYLDRSQPGDYSFAAINWSSMTAADLVVFNSEFHRSLWFTAARTWLSTFPDHHHTSWLDEVERSSVVVAVGVDLARLADRRSGSPPAAAAGKRGVAQILWNHRVDTDKAPQRFVAAMLELNELRQDFTVALAGERFVDSGNVFDPLRRALKDRLVCDGYVGDVDYPPLLWSSDIVVSTARQEFFGIAVTEAVYCGAFPVLPDRVVYPERIPSQFHDRCLYRGGKLAAAVDWALDHEHERRAIVSALRPTMEACGWPVVAPQLDRVLGSVASQRNPRFSVT